jgi:DNA-binding PadR family transcriptional regulator
MAGRQLTVFEHILLGLICAAPASGYDLKQKFAATPMGVYKPSSGALYPALRRLVATGLIQAQAPSGEASQSARQRCVYEPTHEGRAEHVRWLNTPVEPATVARDLGLHLMRFVMMERVLAPADVLAFLRTLADALAAFVAQLDHYAATTDLDISYARLALDHGLRVHRASLGWVNHAISALSAADLAIDRRFQLNTAEIDGR